jgi:hypothetical protein
MKHDTTGGAVILGNLQSFPSLQIMTGFLMLLTNKKC